MIIITYRKKECTWERGKVGFKIFDVNKTRQKGGECEYMSVGESQ